MFLGVGGHAQSWDPLGHIAEGVSKYSEGKLKLTIESRARYEMRTGCAFGKEPDIESGLVRTRLGFGYKPVNWLRISGMVQDSRAPWYGQGAPSTVRDQADVQEAYVELFPDAKNGIGLTAGRMMLNYGEARLIGSPQWGNLARTYDQARIYYRLPRARFEFLVVSPVKIRIGEFNHPVVGDRVWGAYHSFPDLYRKNLLEVYLLRRDQNRIGGFSSGNRLAGTDRLRVNTFGFRLAGPLARGVKHSLEAALQTGMVGTAEHRAAAWFAGLSRRWLVARKPLDVWSEYKFASGIQNPGDARRSGTFDQLYPANHDKFGHQDLFGWRNLHHARSLGTVSVTKAFAVNVMYSSFWLASLRDSLYSGSGKSIARSADGTAGRHVGQEADMFGAFKYKRFTLGAGYGHFFAGEFVQRATPGVGPHYLYLFHTYSY